MRNSWSGFWLGALLLSLATLLAWQSALADAPLVRGGARADGIAAVIGGAAPGPGVDLVLLSDVDLRARIMLTGRLNRPAAGMPVPPSLMASTLEQIVGEFLIAREADRVHIAAPRPEALAEERARLQQEAGGATALAELLRRTGATRGEIGPIIQRRAVVAAFLQANLEGTTVITDAEVERVYETGEHPFGDRPLAEVQRELRALIAREAVDRAVRRWVNVLRARTVVTVLVGFEG